MECGTVPVLDTLIKRFTQFDPATGCSVVVTGHTDELTEGVDCTSTHRSTLELLAMCLYDADAVVAVDTVIAAPEDISAIECGSVLGLATMFRKVLLMNDTRAKIKVVMTSEMVAVCSGCDTPKQGTSLLAKILGTLVMVNGEVRVRAELADGTYPQVVGVSCAADASPRSLLNGALSYDATTETWYWNIFLL